MKAVLDTNILVDYLLGLEQAKEEMARYEGLAISIITWMEVLVGARDEAEAETLRSFLEGFEVLPLDAQIANRAVDIRRSTRIRLPDAVVWASAQARGLLLVTRNTRDFPPGDPGVRVPYQVRPA